MKRALDWNMERVRWVSGAIFAVALTLLGLGWALFPAAKLFGSSVAEPGGDRTAFIALVSRDLPFLGRHIVSCQIGVERAGQSIVGSEPGRSFCTQATKDDGAENRITWSANGASVQFFAGAQQISLELRSR